VGRFPGPTFVRSGIGHQPLLEILEKCLGALNARCSSIGHGDFLGLLLGAPWPIVHFAVDRIASLSSEALRIVSSALLEKIDVAS